MALLGCAGGQPQTAPSPAAAASATHPATPSPAPPPPVAERAEAPLPVPRQEVASAATAAGVYVVGGFDAARRDTSTVFLYDGAWRAGPAYPLPVDHAAAATLGGALYVAGGNSLGVARSDFFRLDPGGWTRLAPLRHPRGALALVAAGGRLYALGGLGPAGEVAAVEAWDPGAGAWSDVAVLPDPRDHGAGFSTGAGLACLAGGRTPATARVDCLDPAGGGWSRLPDLPAATSGAGGGDLAGTLLVAGGEDAGESRLIPEVFRLAPGAAAWTAEPMLVPRHGIQLAVLRGRAYACGGATAAGYQAATACTSLA